MSVSKSLTRSGLLLLLLSGGVGGPEASAAELPVLRQVSEIRQLTMEQAARGYPVHIRAVVTYYSPIGPNFLGRDVYMSTATPDVFVQDATAGIWVNVPKGAPRLEAGQLIDLEGITEIPDFAPQIGQPKYQVIGSGPLPAPKNVSLERMLSTAEDSQWVETQGVVRHVRLSENMLALDVAVTGGRLKGVIPGVSQIPANLVDAEVRIKGACGAIFNKKLQLVGVLLYIPSLDQIAVMRSPEDPFAEPVRALERVARFAPEQAVEHRIHVQGVVTLQDSHKTIYLSDGQTGLRVESTEPVWFKPGDRLDVVGFPRVADYNLIIEDATCRRRGRQQLMVPLQVTAEQVVSGDYDSLPISIEGRLLAQSSVSGRQTLVLKNGRLVFTAILRQDDLAKTLKSIATNSVLRVAGI